MISDVLAQKITDLWKSVGGTVPRYDKPVLQVVIDGNGEPKFVTEAMLSGVGTAPTLSEQEAQTTLLQTIATASLPDKETPTMLYRVKAGMSFTGAIAGDPILGILTINTVTNTFVSSTPLWYNGRSKAALANEDVDTSKLEIVAANSLTASELATLTLSIGATARVCVSHQGITVPITTGVTLASLCSGAIIPVGAVTAEIQAQNGVVRYRLDASTVTPTSGKRINVDENCVIDSVLASVRVVAETAAVTCSVAFFDRV